MGEKRRRCRPCNIASVRRRGRRGQSSTLRGHARRAFTGAGRFGCENVDQPFDDAGATLFEAVETVFDSVKARSKLTERDLRSFSFYGISDLGGVETGSSPWRRMLSPASARDAISRPVKAG
jgi:hypothetical protein